MHLSATLARRRVLQLAASAVLAPGLSSCSLGRADIARADVPRSPPDRAAAPAVVKSTCAFSVDLARTVLNDANLICSPFSVLTALAMVRNGAEGETARQMDETLHLAPAG